MIDRSKFYKCAKASNALPQKLTQEQVDSIEAIFNEWEKLNDADTRKLAYILATTKHETANTFLPIEERGSEAYLSKYWSNPRLRSQLGNVKPSDASTYKGRSYVQITGRGNYANASKKLGVDLVANPVLAMAPENAAKIIILGLTQGWFTGRKLTTYFNHTTEDSFNARKTVNGLDKAGLISSYYKMFKSCLI